jgi:hypothetical protein
MSGQAFVETQLMMGDDDQEEETQFPTVADDESGQKEADAARKHLKRCYDSMNNNAVTVKRQLADKVEATKFDHNCLEWLDHLTALRDAKLRLFDLEQVHYASQRMHTSEDRLRESEAYRDTLAKRQRNA